MSPLLRLYRRAGASARRALPIDALLPVDRLAIASVFFLSGRSKVEGLLTITDSTYELFRTEYALPFIDPVIAADGFGIDDVVLPSQTRRLLLECFGRAQPRRPPRVPGKRRTITPA